MRDFTFALFFLSLSVFTGCASATDPSRTLARETLVEVVAYEQTVRQLHDQLEKVYREHLSGTAAGISDIQWAIEQVGMDELTKVAIERVSTRGFKDEDFHTFVSASATAGDATLAKLEAQLKILRSKRDLEATLTTDGEKKMKAVRRNLDQLQRRPTRKEELKVLGELFEKVRNDLKEKGQ